ncbi:Uncharacterized protein BP5553_06332 [Venustampulla echinocandica]|uniref:Glyoxalase/fosfomycin resistance/dioxygenase domain-containing protein n=1 Tax=Venustampulla echinocandica TaxID=2656787 RepID=A0A370TJL5_9HELO|nr:Uncharacterized protein BP5553_06332 [Venustampulla echinocandica]RDL35720.1 Uncharacterized protein BP5553_06332 [Venustampulla echinocandica]
MPLDHFSVIVPAAKLDGMVEFLISSLGHLGFKEHMRPIPTVIGMGDAMPFLWLYGAEAAEGDVATTQEKLIKMQHIAFTAENAEQVRAYHAAALKAGGTCNGAPGPRPQYHPGYYGAFVLDPVCGINVEVVCHSCVGEA